LSHIKKRPLDIDAKQGQDEACYHEYQVKAVGNDAGFGHVAAAKTTKRGFSFVVVDFDFVVDTACCHHLEDRRVECERDFFRFIRVSRRGCVIGVARRVAHFAVAFDVVGVSGRHDQQCKDIVT